MAFFLSNCEKFEIKRIWSKLSYVINYLFLKSGIYLDMNQSMSSTYIAPFRSRGPNRTLEA